MCIFLWLAHFSLAFSQAGAVNPRFHIGSGANGNVQKILRQADGKILVAGDFTRFNNVEQRGLVRLHPNGSVDSSFRPPLLQNSVINDIALQWDGKILVCGRSVSTRQNSTGIIRLNSDGTPDSTLHPQIAVLIGTGIASRSVIRSAPEIMSLVVGGMVSYQSLSSSILQFTETTPTESGISGRYVGTTFIDPIKMLTQAVRNPRVPYDTSLIVLFNNGSILRFDSALRQDSLFRSPQALTLGFVPRDFDITPEGKIILVGTGDGSITSKVAMLNPDGTIDNTFRRPAVTQGLTAVAVQPNGKILLGSDVRFVSSSSGTMLHRLLPDGRTDSTFQAPRSVFGSVSGASIARIIAVSDSLALIGGLLRDAASNVIVPEEARNLVGVYLEEEPPMQFTSIQPQAATVGVDYPIYRIRATGSPQPIYELAPESGALPGGMRLTAEGFVVGKPIQAGKVQNIIVRATNPLGFITSTRISITVQETNAPTMFLAQNPPNGAMWLPYTPYQFRANGTPMPIFELSPRSRRLPQGLTLAQNGLLSKSSDPFSPRFSSIAPGQYDSIIVRARNSFGFVDSEPFSITILGAAPAQFTNTAFPFNGFLGNVYAWGWFTTNGGVPPGLDFSVDALPLPVYRLAPNSSPLPSGLELSTNGSISGIPTTTGIVENIIVRAQNSAGFVDSRPFSIAILGQRMPTYFAPFTPQPRMVYDSTRLQQSLQEQLFANGVPAPVFGLSPQSKPLPRGLEISTTGVISGIPTTLGVFDSVIVRATNPLGFVESTALSFRVITNTNITLAEQAAMRLASPAQALRVDTSFQSVRLPATAFSFNNQREIHKLVRISPNRILALSKGAFANVPTTATIDSAGAGSVTCLFANGHVDTNFRQGRVQLFRGDAGTATATLALKNGMYLIGGNFHTYNGVPCNGLVRVFPDGRVDTTFNASLLQRAHPLYGFGVDSVQNSQSSGTVNSFAEQENGRILVSGAWRAYNGIVMNTRIIRLLPNGDVDSSFRPKDMFGEIGAIHPLPNGSILLGGAFTHNYFSETSATMPYRAFLGSREGLTLVNDKGDFDTSFVGKLTPSRFGEAYNSHLAVEKIIPLSNGKLMIFGAFSSLNGRALFGMARIFPNGVVDTTFSANATLNWGAISRAEYMPNGTILCVAGGTRIIRLLENGLRDESFREILLSNQAPLGQIALLQTFVRDIISHSSSEAFIAGSFAAIQGAESRNIARIKLEFPPFGFVNQPLQPLEAIQSIGFTPRQILAEASPPPIYTLAENSAPLPQGMTISSGGLLSGTPLVSGTFANIIIRASNRLSSIVSTSITINVRARQIPTMLTTVQSTSALVRVPFSMRVASNAVPEGRFAVASSSVPLPRGLTLSTSGIIAGTPSVVGTFANIVVRVHNEFGVGEFPLTIIVQPQIAPTRFGELQNRALPETVMREPYLFQLTTNARPAATYSYAPNSGELPTGLVLNADGSISGASLRVGTFSGIVIRARNSEGFVDSEPLEITTKARARTSTNGELDTSFYASHDAAIKGRDGAVNVHPYLSGKYGATNMVTCIVRQDDGKFLVAGWFTEIIGVRRGRFARLLSNGAVDTTFGTPEGANAPIYAMQLQADGKILIAGDFTRVSGVARTRIARLNADGTPDAGFQPPAEIDSAITCLETLPDGKILVGGRFTRVSVQNASTLRSVQRLRLMRLHSNGSLDTTFFHRAGMGFNAEVNAVKVLGDGTIAVGGAFTSFVSPSFYQQQGIVFLTEEGRIATESQVVEAFNGAVQTIVPWRAGRTMIGGRFSRYEGSFGLSLMRLLPNRQPDIAYGNNTASMGTFLPTISAIAPLADGRILLGGGEFRYSGSVYGLVMLHPNGLLDRTFDAGFGAHAVPNPRIVTIAVEPGDSTAVIGGYFERYDGLPAQNIARIKLTPSILPNRKVSPFDVLTAAHTPQPFPTNDDIVPHNNRLEDEVIIRKSSLLLSPNPSSDRVICTLALAKSGVVRLSVVDVLGNNVLTFAEQSLTAGEIQVEIPLQNIRTGVYFVRFQAGGEMLVQKLCVIR